MSAPVRTRRIALGDVTLAVDEAGEGGRPLLCVHGFCGCRQDFSPILPALVDAGWHVAMPDLRGHGDSDHPPGDAAYDLDRFLADVAGVADALGWERFTLVGHSLGGVIAQHVTLTEPGRVRALVLLSSFSGPIDIDPDLLRGAAAVVRTEGIDRLIVLLEERDDPMGSPAHERAVATIEGYRDRGERNLRRCSPTMVARVYEQLGTFPDRTAELASRAVPTLVVVGDEDGVMGPSSARLAAAVPGARLEVVAGAGHAPQFEQTGPLTEILLTFLTATVEDRRPG